MIFVLFKKKKKQEEDFEVDAYETEDIDDEETDEDEEEEKTPLVKPKKQKKTSPVLQKNPIHSYKFWFKIFGAILLIILGFFLLFKLNTEIIVMIRIFFVGRDFLIYIYIILLIFRGFIK